MRNMKIVTLICNIIDVLIVVLMITRVNSKAESQDFDHIFVHVVSYGDYNEVTDSHISEYDVECEIPDETPSYVVSLFNSLYILNEIDYHDCLTPIQVLNEDDIYSLRDSITVVSKGFYVRLSEYFYI